MDKTQYLKNVAATVAHFEQLTLEELLIDQKQVNNFSMASLALSHFIRSIKVSDHGSVIKDILTFQHITMLGQQYPIIVKDAILDDNVLTKLQELKSNPHVIATFHFGSYRQINSLLLEHDVPFALVISSATISEQSREFLKKSQEYFNKSFTLIDAESPSCLISMIKEIKKGKSLVIYLDGNIGAGGNKAKQDSLCSIDFLNGNLHVRKGAAYISHIAKVPILTASCFLENYKDLYFDFGKSITPGEHEERENYALSTMQELYSHFTHVLEKYPQQWEAWFYLHKNIDNKKLPGFNHDHTGNNYGEQVYDPSKLLRFNLKHYSLFKGTSEYYVLDKRTFLSYPLREDAYTLLLNCLAKENFKINASNKILAGHLIEKNLLIMN
ncbi:MAG: hypothetical protein ABIN89_01820 [Chitinophagaceae bacterium]